MKQPRFTDLQPMQDELRMVTKELTKAQLDLVVLKLDCEFVSKREDKLRDLLRRAMRQLKQWQEKYGEHQPEWFPPTGDIRLAEDVAELLEEEENGLYRVA